MRWIFFYCLFSISFRTQAQPKTLSVDHLNVETGVPENYAADIVQDKKGYMWIGTQLGLVRYDGYSVKVYKEELDKVKSGFYGAYALFIDRHKTLWVGTQQQGLLKYDPVRDTFTTYPYSKIKDDTLRSIRKILEDAGGNLWLFGVNAKSTSYTIFKFNEAKGQFTGFGSNNKNGVPATRVLGGISDKAGDIWVTTNNGIYKFDPAGNKFIGHLTSADIKKQKTFAIPYEAPSEPGILYMDIFDSVGCYGMTRYNTTNNTYVTFSHSNAEANSILNDTVYSIKEDDSHRLWVGTAAGLSMFNRTADNFTNFKPKDHFAEKTANHINVIQDDVNGFLWLSSGNGLLSFNPVTREFTRYLSDINREDALPTNAFLKIFRDSSGGIWLTTRGFGVQKINNGKSRFTLVRNIPDQPESYNSGRVYDIVQDPDHSFWMGTAKGLCHYDPVKNSFKNIKLFDDPVAANLAVAGVIQAKKGIIWAVHTSKGILSYDPASGKIKSYNIVKNDTTSLSDSVVTKIYEDHNGTIWVGTRTGGICRFNKEKKNFTRYPFIINSNHSYPGKYLDDRTVLSIFEDSKRRLWVGTNQGGINLMDRNNGTFTSFQDLQKGLGCINGITEDNKGRLWLASYVAGVSIFDPGTANTQRFTEKNGLLCNVSMAISKDAEGNIWIASPRGLSFINTETLVIKNFTKVQGLPDNDFRTAIFSNSDGQLMAGYKSGLVLFPPSIAKPNNVIPVTNIESVSFSITSDERERDSTIIISGQQKIELSYDENRLTFHYVGLQYENATLNKYRYKLEGYDKDWIEAGTLRAATYTNLSPGTYTFYVNSANSDGIWNEKPQSIKVIIHPPWWKTWWAYLLYILVFCFAVWKYLNYYRKKIQRENRVLEEKVVHRTAQLQSSIESLKATQQQLIQSEKMASLGELTAGIAHEIQNPLNFVNNFSEVNTELIEELKQELATGKMQEAISIADDIKENEQKINYHGKRADAIVKGMLQHSRASSGKKESTDINALCDEYLRLSYHGLRAKDKSFNASMQTDFDEKTGMINVMPQDIGRVLLNLFTNAFYSVAEKKKQQANGYEPIVTVTTKRLGSPSELAPNSIRGDGGKIEINVKDNGMGIPQKVLDKIYQPFFTTKPTGEGTGLGLSLSYDIIKAHGGEIKVETKEGEGSEFIIHLPIF